MSTLTPTPMRPLAGALAGVAALVIGCRVESATPPDAGDAAAAPDEADLALDGADVAETVTPETLEFDLGRDFSFTNNPSGPWRYGSTRTPTLAAADFQLDGFAVATTPVGFWHPAEGAGGYYPYVAANVSAAASADPTSSWALRPGEISMEASADGRYAAVQFVAPAAGAYDVEADFEAVHFRLSTTDVHVLDGETSLLSAQLDGYGGDPAFHAVQGANPRASYHGTRTLQVGEVLTFAVGVGANGTYVNDTTGLMLRIRH
jgi:hypothetical protein